MQNSDLVLNEIERRIVEVRKEILEHVQFAERQMEYARQAIKETKLQYVLNIARNSLDLAREIGTLDELESNKKTIESLTEKR